MPGCHDAMSARLVEEAGFDLGFMSGFAVSADRLALPDTGLISYGELVEQGQNICRAAPNTPFIGDGDTGFGSAQNIKRTVQGYARAGFAGIMLEDQVAPKRCGHTEGKSVVGRDEALTRIQAAVDARDAGADILIMARTDARACVDLDEAIERCKQFRKIGADITFLEAPLGADEMRRYCREVDGPKMANLIEGRQNAAAGPRRAGGHRLQDRGVSADPAQRFDPGDARGPGRPRVGRRHRRDGLRAAEVGRRLPRLLRRRSSIPPLAPRVIVPRPYQR